MKLFDRLMDIDPKAAVPDNQHYESYRVAVKWVTVGMVAFVAGLVGDSVGLESLGEGVMVAGGAVAWLGAVGLIRETPHLSKDQEPTAP